MTQAPFTQTQIAEKSILDIFGRQTYLGNSFILPHPGITLSDTSEDPIMVLKNPAGSGKSMFLFVRKVLTNGNTVVVKTYLNPTVNVPGSATVPLNLRTGSTLASISTCYEGATITSNGTHYGTVAAQPYSSTTDTLLVLDPGGSLLLTGTAVAQPVTVYVEIAWYEI